MDVKNWTLFYLLVLSKHDMGWFCYCRSMEQIIDIQDPQVRVPAMLIMGEKDYVMKFPGMEENIRSGAIKKLVPDLEVVFMPEGNQFVQEQLPEEVNELIISFLNKNIV